MIKYKADRAGRDLTMLEKLSCYGALASTLCFTYVPWYERETGRETTRDRENSIHFSSSIHSHTHTHTHQVRVLDAGQGGHEEHEAGASGHVSPAAARRDVALRVYGVPRVQCASRIAYSAKQLEAAHTFGTKFKNLIVYMDANAHLHWSG